MLELTCSVRERPVSKVVLSVEEKVQRRDGEVSSVVSGVGETELVVEEGEEEKKS
jgi:hypothetical protein